MKKTPVMKEISAKSTKEQILAAYNDVLKQLTEEEVATTTPKEQKDKEEQQKVVASATKLLSGDILSDLSNLKTKSIKQIDGLSEQILGEFEKLKNLREAIAIEKRYLEELYQINDTVNTLSALLQAQAQQKKSFELEMEETQKVFEQQMVQEKANWQQQRGQLEHEYKELKASLEKTKKREEEEYSYNLELKRRKEADEYNAKKAAAEKELVDLKNDILRREANLVEKEKHYESLEAQVGQIPTQIQEAVANAEESMRAKLLQQYEFETQLKQKEYEGTLNLKNQSISYLEDKIKKQEATIKELTEKADLANKQVESIACRAVDASAQRFVNLNAIKPEEKKI